MFSSLTCRGLPKTGALYKTKCAACHGPEGAGKEAIKSLVSDEAKKMSDADMTKFLSSNPEHAGAAKALTPKPVTAIISHVANCRRSSQPALPDCIAACR